MRFHREINIHTDDVPQLFKFIEERHLGVSATWDVNRGYKAAGMAGKMDIPIYGKGTISGEVSEQEATALNTFIADLEARYWRQR
jgi:hypothetical protein